MKKTWYKSKTLQGVVLSVIGAIWGIWVGDSTIAQTIVVAGLGWAGYGVRDALN